MKFASLLIGLLVCTSALANKSETTFADSDTAALLNAEVLAPAVAPVAPTVVKVYAGDLGTRIMLNSDTSANFNLGCSHGSVPKGFVFKNGKASAEGTYRGMTMIPMPDTQALFTAVVQRDESVTLKVKPLSGPNRTVMTFRGLKEGAKYQPVYCATTR